MLVIEFSRVGVLPVGVVIDELGEVRVCEDLVNAIVILWDVEHVGLITCERCFGRHGSVLCLAVQRKA